MKSDAVQKWWQTPLTKSVGLHLSLVLILFISSLSFWPKPTQIVISGEAGSSAASAPPPPPAPVEAVAIDKQVLEQRVAEIKKQQDDARKAEEQRIRDLERRAQQAERSRAAEEARLKRVAEEKRKADEAAQASRRAAAEAKKQQETEAAKAKAAEQQRIAREQERKKAEEAAKAAEAKRKAEQEALAKAQAERERKAREDRERAEQERMMQEQMSAEAEARRRARAQQAVTEVQRYTAMISDAIDRNLIKDESTMRGRTCRVNIRLATNGFVTSVNVISGERVVCDAAVRAVNRAGTLPMSPDPDVYNQLKDITLTVAPEFR
ncbi:cell envelope integrity protein TolA [Alishewanella longhuensis]